MKSTDKFAPVIIVVIYYGEKPWDGATTLCEMLDIPDVMKEIVNNYKMYLVEARKNNLKLHNINNQDLFNLFGILLNTEEKMSIIREKAIKYTVEHKVEKNVILTVTGAGNCKMDYSMLEGKGDTNMWTVFEETRKEGEVRGKASGEAKGIIETASEFGLSNAEILTRLQEKLNISQQKAQEYLTMFGKQTV